MKSIKLTLGLLIVILILVNQAFAQDDKSHEIESKKEEKESSLFWGGSIWLGFGTYTFADVNVVFGSQLTDRISLGVSGKYQYYNDKRSLTGDFETSVYGGSVFSQIAIVKDFRNLIKVKGHSGIMAHVEYEFLNTEFNYIYFDEPDLNYNRYWLHNILLGGGYFQKFGKNSKSYIILLWNVYESAENPYEYPQLKIGFTIGI